MPRNKVTSCQISSASAFPREVYRRRSHNTRSTGYSWLGLIVQWVTKASTVKLLAADLLSIFAGVFQGRSRECYPQFKLAHCCFPNVFQARFFYPSSKKQKIWDHTWSEINVFSVLEAQKPSSFFLSTHFVYLSPRDHPCDRVSKMWRHVRRRQRKNTQDSSKCVENYNITTLIPNQTVCLC